MDQYIVKKGIQESELIENALLYHINALLELPEEVIVPPKIVVSKETGMKLRELLENPPEPTDAMKELCGIGQHSSS